MKTLILAAFALAPLGLAAPQDDPQGKVLTQQELAEIPDASEFALVRFAPKTGSARELYDVAYQFYGRRAQIKNGKRGQVSTHSTIQLMGDSIVIYETKDARERILTALTALDKESADTSSSEPAPSLKVVEYRPKNVPMNSLLTALEPFHVALVHGGRTFRNITSVNEQGLLILRDYPERVSQMLDLVTSVDKPSPQMLVSAFLVAGSDEVESEGLPKVLVDDLSSLLGVKGLTKYASGVVRASTSPDTKISLAMRTKNGETTRLDFTIGAFDAAKGSLTFETCEFVFSNAPAFKTRTSVGKDQFVVLGASGSDPAYVVLHIRVL